MELEKGKFYKTRGGLKAEVVAFVQMQYSEPRTLIVITYENGYNSYLSVLSNGCFREHYESEIDVISEWIEPLDFDWDCLPAWSNFIAMNEDGNWYHYSDKPCLYYDFWSGFYRYGIIPLEYAPKNYTGDWKDSLHERPSK